MTMITPSYLGETIEYSSLHACRSTLEDPTVAVEAALLAPVAALAIPASANTTRSRANRAPQAARPNSSSNARKAAPQPRPKPRSIRTWTWKGMTSRSRPTSSRKTVNKKPAIYHLWAFWRLPLARRLSCRLSLRASPPLGTIKVMDSDPLAPDSSEHLCQSCGTMAARDFLCQITDGQKTTFNLCDDCFRSHTTQTGLELPSLDGAQCFYCGGAAIAAGMNQEWEIAVRQQRFHYTCARCAQLSQQLTMEAIASLPEGLPDEEQLHRIEQVVRDVDARVRDIVRDDLE